MAPRQLILFGSPGVGKSHLIEHSLLPDLGIDPHGDACIKTVFHPEYSYGDFMGKLLPISKDGRVEYNFYEGHLLRALARAYRAILDDEENPKQVALVVDEINRGNSAAIFGTVFQLLDRGDTGWSDYHVNISQMEFERLIEMIGIRTSVVKGSGVETYKFQGKEHSNLESLLSPLRIKHGQVRLPHNLSIFATMNTSDTSIYYMDSAFKRRWDWEFINVDSSRTISTEVAFHSRTQWEAFITKLNSFIRKNSSFIRNLEDKQLGFWFIKDEEITKSQVQNKLMFFLWDSVFPRDKKPLASLIGAGADGLATFGDFAGRVDEFIRQVKSL